MTPDERRMIEDLFERLSAERPQAKDRQAEALIRDLIRDVPDSAYMLVQTLLVYEHQLQEAGDRIQNLEAELDDRASSNSSGGSFLSGRVGSSSGAGQRGRPAASRGSNEYRDEATSVPRVGGSAPWGSTRPTAAPNTRQDPRNAEPPRAGGGGFFRSAMTTAAGVAGGMLAADSLRSLFGGSSSAHASDTQKSGAEPAAPTTQETANTNQDTTQDQSQDYDDTDDDWGADDFGGGDIEI